MDPKLLAIEDAFFKIAHCEIAFAILDDTIKLPHPCRSIVESQPNEQFQLPEPWLGHIESAPLLFIASNPSIGEDKHALRESTHDEVWNSHVNVFESDAGYTHEGIYTVLPNGTRSPEWVRHWAFVRSQARTLFGRDPKPGKDYSITEVAHCKSKAEIGVSVECASFCANTHLRRVLEVAGCRVIVAMGDHAKRELRRFFGFPGDAVFERLSKNRGIVFMPHSNFRGPRKIERIIPQHLAEIRAILNAT